MASFERVQGRNQRKAYTLAFALFLLLSGLIAIAVMYFGATGPAVMLFAAVAAAGTTLVSWWKSDRIVLAMTRATVVTAEQYPQLHNVVEEVCIAAGLPKPAIAVVSDMAPNAFATGRDPHHSVVAFTTGLLDCMERDELQGVVAHELAHIANRDTLVMTIAATTAGAIALVSDLSLRLLWFGGGRRRSNSRGGHSGLALVGIIIAAVLAPIAATLLKGALSRSREGLADASAVAFTRNPAGLRRALQKLASDSTVVTVRSTAVAHLWIECPLDTSSRLGRLFSTHPPIEERIEVLLAMEGTAGAQPSWYA